MRFAGMIGILGLALMASCRSEFQVAARDSAKNGLQGDVPPPSTVTPEPPATTPPAKDAGEPPGPDHEDQGTNDPEPLPLPPMPGPVQTLGAKTAEDGRVTLRWQAPWRGGAVGGYRVYRGTTSPVATTGTPLAEVAATTLSHVDATVTNGTRYFYRVVAFNAAGAATAAVEADATPLAAAATPASVRFVAAGATGGDGSRAAPFGTIAAAYAAVTSGGTVVVLDGTYDVTASLSLAKPVTIRSEYGQAAFSNALVRYTGGASAIALDVNATDVTVAGMGFTAFVGGVSTGVIRAPGSTDRLRLVGNAFVANQAPAVTSGASGIDGFAFDANVVTNVTGASLSGIFLNKVSNGSISFNVIDGMPYGGMNLQELVNCDVSGNQLRNIAVHGLNVTTNSDRVRITDNLIDGANTTLSADSGGIRIYGTSLAGPLHVLRNKVIHSFNGLRVRSGENLGGKTVVVRDNHFEANDNAGASHGGTGTLDVSGNYWGSPLGPYHATLNPDGAMTARIDAAEPITFTSFLTESPWAMP